MSDTTGPAHKDSDLTGLSRTWSLGYFKVLQVILMGN